MSEYTVTFTQDELLALGECYTAAMLGPNAPGTAQAEIQGALWSNR